MSEQKPSIVLISDFNIDVLAGYLSNGVEKPAVEASTGPFGSVVPVLLARDGRPSDAAVVWTRPEAVIEEFAKALSFQEFSTAKALGQVEEFARAVLNLKGRCPVTFVASWTIPTQLRGWGLLDWKAGVGAANLLAQMNLRLAQELEAAAGFYLLNTGKWIEAVGKDAFSEKLLHMGKIPFTHTVFKLAALDIKAALRALAGETKKMVIVDLDDTLWPGLVGNDGWQALRLGGHDPEGEAFVAFQKALKSLTRRGIILGIVSKNDEHLALEAIDTHPEMVLRRQDFAGWRINWKDKAQNIADLAAELNLGLSSVVFIDDSPHERERVRQALPEVLVPEWPQDKILYAQALLGLSCFDTPALSREDRGRAQMYRAEEDRRQAKTNMGSLEQWLESLGTTIKVEEIDQANLVRAAQLLNKTNQMNLSTRRMTEGELLDWVRRPGHNMWAFSVSDKFGDSGLTGLLGLQTGGGRGQLTDFVLSCRVLGRGVEEAMMQTALEFARSCGLERIEAQYLPTTKNSPCLEFFSHSGFERREDVFSWALNKEYAMPAHVNVVGPAAKAAK